MNNTFRKLTRFLFLFVLPIAFFVVLAISYFALRKLVFPVDLVMSNGKKQSEVIPILRSNILKRKDTKVVSFKTKDGLKLVGHFLKRPRATSSILLCHGYQSYKESLAGYIDMFPKSNILLFDFRTHGQSEGRFRTLGCHEYKDVIAAVQFLKEDTKQDKTLPNALPLVILGHSMGGSAALKAMESEPNLCDALILDSSFSNLPSVIYNTFKIKSGLPNYPFVPVTVRMVNFFANCDINKMRPIDSLKHIQKPIFFIHSCVDAIVPANDSLLMYANTSNENKKLWVGPVCKHGDLHKKYFDIYKRKVDKFLKKAI